MILQGSMLEDGREPRASKLRFYTLGYDIAPFQGWSISDGTEPRALPWAVISRPVGARPDSTRNEKPGTDQEF